MNFSDYSYLWPPRPEKAVPSMMLDFYENRGHWGQFKKNGTCSVLAVAPDKSIRAMNRHAEEHKMWAPTRQSSAAFETLPGNGWYVFVAELLNNKVTNGPKDYNYLNDILVADGEYLVGTTFADRMKRLSTLFKTVGEEDSHYVVDNHTGIAKCHTEGFSELYSGLHRPEDEGLVIKNPAAKLAVCGRESSNVNWMVKCRRSTKNYAF
jgi:hypothetical protein